jgi:hypothetical protein
VASVGRGRINEARFQPWSWVTQQIAEIDGTKRSPALGNPSAA